MPATLEGEATPRTDNTAPINPLTFDEAALAKALKIHLDPAAVEPTEEQTPKEPPVETPPAEPEAPEPLPGDGVEPPAEGEEQPAGETEAVEEETDPSGVQKRINKLTAQKKEAQEKAEALEHELNDLKTKVEGLEAAPPTVPAGSDPFSNVHSESVLREKWEQARMLKRWCEDNVDGCEFNGREYSAEEVKQIRHNVEDALEVGIPRRAAYLDRYRQIRPEAERLYPFWKDKQSPEYGEAQVILREMPGITNYPDYQISIGDFLVGRALRLAKAKQPRPAAGVVKALPPIAPKQPTKPLSAARVNGEQAQFEARKKKFLSTGSVSELAQVLKGHI